MRKIFTMAAVALLGTAAAAAAGPEVSYFCPDNNSQVKLWKNKLSTNLTIGLTADATITEGACAVIKQVDGDWSESQPLYIGSWGATYIMADFNNTEPPADGAYTVTIPAGSLSTADGSNEEWVLNWTVSGHFTPSADANKPITATEFTLTFNTYEKDENGDTKYDENYNPIVAKTESYNLLDSSVAIPNLTDGISFTAKLDGPSQLNMAEFVLWGGEEVIRNWEVIPENGVYTWKPYMNADIILYNNVEYKFQVIGYDGTASWNSNEEYGPYAVVTFKGTTEPYVFAEAQLISVEPEGPNDWQRYEFTNPETPIVATFNAPVANATCRLFEGGQGSIDYNITGTPNADKTVWTFVAADVWPTVSSGLNCSIAATDAEGRTVDIDPDSPAYAHKQGVDAGVNYETYYNCYLGCPHAVLNPSDGSTVKELYSFVAAQGADVPAGYSGLNFSWNAFPYLLNDAGEEVASTAQDYEDLERLDENMEPLDEDAWDVNPTFVRFHLTKKITEAGVYTLVVPSGTFVFGDQQTSENSARMECQYTVDPNYVPTAVEAVAGSDVRVAATAEGILVSGVVANVKVYALDGALVADVDANGEAAIALPAGLYVVVVDGNALKIRK